MPDASPPVVAPSPLARLGAWLRQRYDAELLATVPHETPDGELVRWTFPPPVNRSPAWWLLRPHVLLGGLPVTLAILVAAALRGSGTAGAGPAAAAWGWLMFTGSNVALWSALARTLFRRRYDRMALDTFRHYQWERSRALDAEVAARMRAAPAPARAAATHEMPPGA